jgi:hypothetical protein
MAQDYQRIEKASIRPKAIWMNDMAKSAPKREVLSKENQGRSSLAKCSEKPADQLR